MIEAVHHRLAVRCELGALRLDVSLELAAPWTVVFGPSGSGKSSLLRAACGILPGAKVEFERHTSAGWVKLEEVASYQRLLGYAPQAASLFPHMNVSDNVGFATTQRPSGRAAWRRAEPVVDEAIKLFGLSELEERMPRGLSGGEQQRVNLARAFVVPGAKLMLLDEPFSGVDRKMRDGMLLKMKAWMAELGVPVVSVTHDVDEALLLGAEVVRMEAGRVVAQGPAAEVLAEERERMLANLG